MKLFSVCMYVCTYVHVCGGLDTFRRRANFGAPPAMRPFVEILRPLVAIQHTVVQLSGLCSGAEGQSRPTVATVQSPAGLRLIPVGNAARQ